MMASHHHHHDHAGGCHSRHHNHRESIPLVPTYYATSSPCICVDSSPCCIKTNQQPSPPNLDHLLCLILSYLQNQPQCSCKTHSPRFNGVRQGKQSFVVNQQQQNKNVQREYDNLLHKIEDIDLYLTRRGSYSTLKDSAARVIQTHFRSYLVCRSISLRQLKELAAIKSSFFSLKSSVSGKTNFPFQTVSRETSELLHQLNSIKGRLDPMIREGKRTLSRDLVRFLHYVDDCAVKRRDLVRKLAKHLSFRGKCKSSGAKPHVGEDRTTEKFKKQIRTIYVTSNGEQEEENIAESDDGKGIPIVPFEKSRKVGSFKSKDGALRQCDKVKTPIIKSVKFGKNRNAYELTSSAENDSSDDGEEILMMSRDEGIGSNSRSGVVIKGNGVMKSVRFDENGNVYRVYGNTPEESVSEGDDSSTSGSNNQNADGYNEVEDLIYVAKENEGLEEEETHSENEQESSSSEGTKEAAQVNENVSHVEGNEHKREFQLQKEVQCSLLQCH